MNLSRSTTINLLSVLILALAAFATAAGIGLIWPQAGSSYDFTTLRGETVTIYGRGLYRYDTVSVAAQGIAQDVVTLLIGIPLLVISLVFAHRGSLRGKLLLVGTLGYFLYGYAAFAFGAATYNPLFLVYVTLFTLSLFAFLLALSDIELEDLPLHFTDALPRRSMSIFAVVVGVFLLMSWLGRIIPSLIENGIPVGLQSYSTLVIQTLDLSLIVPLAFLSAVLLWRRTAWGYLLMAILLLKGFTLALSITAGVIGQLLAGVPLTFGEIVMFPLLTAINVVLTYLFLRHVNEAPVTHIRVTSDGQPISRRQRLVHDQA